jgi:DNA ligase-1
MKRFDIDCYDRTGDILMFLSPMLLQKAKFPTSDDTHICELKLDGIRLILSNVGGQLQCWTRHGTPCLERFPELRHLELPLGVVLDGELIVADEQGYPDFEAIMIRFQITNRRKIDALMQSLPVEYCVFDILMFNGQDITHLPLHERKQILHEVIQDQPHLTLVRSVPGKQAQAFFELIRQQGLEGVVLKRKDSTYQIGKRSNDWLKLINYQYHNVRLTGLKKDEFGWLIGVEEGGRVRPAGIIEFPPPEDVRKAVWRIVNHAKMGEDKNIIYLSPDIKMIVKSRGWTKNGMIRIPVFHSFDFGGESRAG